MSDRGQWQSDFVDYHVGDVVDFDGKRYRNIQAHRSQSDWAPNMTPALWEDTGDSSGGGSGYQPSYSQPQQPQQSQQPAPPPPQKWDSAPQVPNSGYQTDDGIQVSQPETEKKWYDLDDKKKNALLISSLCLAFSFSLPIRLGLSSIQLAGGLAIGLSALAGGAYYEHEKHKKEGEESKAQAWELQNWMVAARQRTEQFLNEGPRAPVTWVYSEFLDMPALRDNLVLGGEEHGHTWYIARAPHIGGLQPGKCRPKVGAFFGFGHEAIHVKQYEALIGDSRGVRWVPMSGRFSFETLGARAVEGGREDDGTPLAIARGRAKEHSGFLGIGSGGAEGLFPGKASPKLDGAYVTVGEKEVRVEEYEVLAYV
ncbi:hypothetical protein EW145_g2940 [Phellinidium pouzarii]|uniref:Chitin-binding type-3 domain-containing protein n=1 Tax=Phellinidium pouzarii TaxID=167371 RepID=A0A4S4L965_9AGAM|nr:hypothetical protein EW145_g2940 [Phellinidium pouzarii]